MLPKPPTDKEKHLYTDQNKWLVYTWALISYAALVIGMYFFTTTITIWWSPILILTIVYLGLSYIVGVFGKKWDHAAHVWKITNHWLNWTEKPYPTIDVFLPSCGEPVEVIENTFKYTRRLKWPEGRIHFFCLDDSNRPEIKRLADKYEYTYIVRPDRPYLKKAGNIRHAFPLTSGEFILILDADFVPRSDMLAEMVPYFEDEKCAIVQSPQFFSIENTQTWIMKGAAYIQELFYRMIQVHRDTWKASICVGTCALYRRSALEPYGGTYPIEFSEDMHTGWQLTVDGYYVKYIPINLSKGLCPDSMSAFFVQQTRWCTGSVGLLLSKKFWFDRGVAGRGGLTFMQRLCYISGQLYYIATALMVIVGPLPPLIVLSLWPEKIHWYNYLWSIPSFLMSVVILNVWSKAPWGTYVLSTRQVSYYAHIFALYNKFTGSLLEWIPSGNSFATKVKDYKKFKTTLFLWTSITTLLTISLISFRIGEGGKNNFDFYPVLFFTLVNYFISINCLKEEA